MPKRKLLVVEDDAGLQKQLRWSLDAYDVLVAGEREAALTLLRRHQPRVVTMDLGLPPDADGATEGLALLQQMLAVAPDTKVIVLSGNKDRANVLKAIAMGAYDFHQKPLDADLLGLVIERAFFLHGVAHLKPMTLKQVADAIEMHESTVSRVTSNKYLSCARGLFELKYFFTSAIQAADGGDAVSAEAVKSAIRALISAEDPKAILSDDTLVDMLNAKGFGIARRTVAKYREAMGIGSSVQRRRQKALEGVG